MPLFDVTCLHCHDTFEMILSLREDPAQVTCPRCGKMGLKKLPATFHTNTWSQFLDTLERRVSPEKFR